MSEQILPGGLFVYKKRDRYEAEFDPDYCAASVSGQGGWHWHQCTRKWKVEKRGHRWCSQHDPDKVEERQYKTSAKYQAKLDARMAPYRKIEKLEAINDDLLDVLARFLERHAHEIKLYGKSFYDNEINNAREVLSRHRVGIISKAEEQMK